MTGGEYLNFIRKHEMGYVAFDQGCFTGQVHQLGVVGTDLNRLRVTRDVLRRRHKVSILESSSPPGLGRHLSG